MANPAGLQTGIDNIAQLNNAYVLASWPADPVQDNVVSYEVQYWKSAGDVSGTATSISGLVVTDNSQSWVAGSLVGARVAMGGMTANVVDNSATTFTVDAWVTGTPAAGAYQISYAYSRRVFGTSLKIDGLFTNTGYTFRLRAQNNVGIWSAWSALKSITTASDTLSPGAPTGLKAYKTPRGALVSWSAVVAADVQGYQVEDVLALQTAITSGGTVTAIAVPPLPVAISPSATITVDSENYTVTGAGAAAGATSIPVVSQTAGASHALNAPVYCQQYIFPAASLTTSLVFTAPSGTPLGTQLQFRVRAQDWSGNFSAWSALSTAITSDGTVFDELMAGNLKVFGTITTGGLQTAASGARFDLNSSRIAGFDNTATNYGLPGGAGNTFWLGADGNAQLKGTLWATIVNASVFIGTGTPPTYTTPSTGFSIDPTNGFRWWNTGTLVAQWAANGALTIFSGASITASTIQSSSGVGSGSSGYGVSLNAAFPYLRIYATSGNTGASGRLLGWNGTSWVDMLSFYAFNSGFVGVNAILHNAESDSAALLVTGNTSIGSLGKVFTIQYQYQPSGNSLAGGIHGWGEVSAVDGAGTTQNYFARTLAADGLSLQKADDFLAVSTPVWRYAGVHFTLSVVNDVHGVGVLWVHRFKNAPTGVTVSRQVSTALGSDSFLNITAFGAHYQATASGAAGTGCVSMFHYTPTGGS